MQAHGAPPPAAAKPAASTSAASASAAAASADSASAVSAHHGAPWRALTVDLTVEAVANHPEKPKVAHAAVLFPPELLSLARRAAATLPGASLVPGSGPQRLKLPLESYSGLEQLVGAEPGATLAPAHPIERAALSYAPPLSQEAAAAAMEAALPPALVGALFEFQVRLLEIT